MTDTLSFLTDPTELVVDAALMGWLDYRCSAIQTRS